MKDEAQKDESEGDYCWLDKARLTRYVLPGWLCLSHCQSTYMDMFGWPTTEVNPTLPELVHTRLAQRVC